VSLTAALPYGQTLDYWWEKLDGHPARRRFMTIKALEVAAFASNGRHNARVSEGADAIVFPTVREPEPWPSDPRLAVVVPIHARSAADARMAQRLVERIRAQTLAPAQIIVVDDASPWSVELAAEVIRLPANRGPAHARNVGIHRALAASPAAVALTDMDCVPTVGWLQAAAAHFAEHPLAHGISGRTDAYDQSWLGRYHELNGTLNGRSLGDGLLYGPTCNLVLRAEVCRDVAFDESFPTAAAEDIDFCLRARLRGWRFEHAAAVRVAHDFGYDGLSKPRKLNRIWRQFRRYAGGERRLLSAHPGYGRLFEVSEEIVGG
jgi:GT2 family glycosyltransferase